MAGTFILGETKVRPGSYFNIRKRGDNNASDSINGITAVLFKADFGPVNQVVELSSGDNYEDVFGNGLTTDAIREAIAGGAKTIIACRLGNGGTKGNVALKDSENATVVTITAKYPGSKPLSVTVRGKLSDSAVKECIIYSGTSQFDKVEFAAGTGEAAALVEALKSSKKFTGEVAEGKDNSIIANVSQSAFTPGTNPTVTASDYSNAFAEVEAFDFNTICIDTEDTAIQLLLQSFVSRIFDAGLLCQAVVAEKHTVELETRMQHAAAFNDEKMNYILNAYLNENGTEIDGYQTAARIAGMIGSVSSASSLTHTVIKGIAELGEKLTNTEVTNAEKKGCIVLTYNKEKQVWIDSAINTLIAPADNQDDGWKKIRRVKTRFELMRRINEATDNLVGKIDNDQNGRSTVVGKILSIGDAMIGEGKLISLVAYESSTYKADGDSAWFDIDVIDKDSMEHIYLTYWYQFSTNAE